MIRLSLVTSLLAFVALQRFETLGVHGVTIYTEFVTDANGQRIPPSVTNSAVGPVYTGYKAYNQTKLIPPALPNPPPNLNFAVQLFAGGMTNLSIKQPGTFMGLSIELSVANQFLGRNSTRINVPFLNYIAGLRSRAGQGPTIRVGGNSQEDTELFFEPFDNHYEITNKTAKKNPLSPTITPEVNIWIDLLYTLKNITAMTQTQWYLGLPFGYPVNFTGIAAMTQIYQDALGDSLLALQMGNEPDLYGRDHRARPTDYLVPEYLAEYGQAVQAIEANPGVPRQQTLIAPSTCCNGDGWRIDDVLNAGLITQYGNNIARLSVQDYPNQNCFQAPRPEDIFFQYMMHSRVVEAISVYTNVAAVAVANNKPLIMFETNTASCAGFSGLSDSFGAGLWAVDWAMQMAYKNFSGALFHFGGQNAAYNAFTPPPSNYSGTYQWSTGPLYYSMLMVAEALGASNVSQVVELTDMNPGDFTPGYAIYENGQPARVLLINYMDDLGTGTNAYTGYIHIGGTNGLPDTSPTSVTVRYMAAASVSEKYNITWAGQTMGGLFESDGRLRGDVNTQTVQCPPTTGCPIRVPAPGAALVFLTPDFDKESSNTDLTTTFPTTYYGHAGPTADQKVLETSNGRGGVAQVGLPYGATSHGKANAGSLTKSLSVALAILSAMAGGAVIIGRGLVVQ